MNEALIRARQTIREAEDQRDRALLCCMAAGFSPTERQERNNNKNLSFYLPIRRQMADGRICEFQ
jgi:hypothetical protein